jgi:hypothetical protein
MAAYAAPQTEAPPPEVAVEALAVRTQPSATIQYTTSGHFLLAIGMSGMNGAIYDVITEGNGAQLIASQILQTINNVFDQAPQWAAADWKDALRRSYFDQHGV